jgi:hypothetical protein
MDDGVAVSAGLLLALVVGVASHWSAGVAVFTVWIVLHGLTWGFAVFLRSGEYRCRPTMESCR